VSGISNGAPEFSLAKRTSSSHLFVSAGEEMVESLDPNEAEARIFHALPYLE